MDFITTPVIEKIRGLLYSLTHTHEELELVADEVEDCKLKTAINGLSMESSIYASEICMQLKELGIKFPRPALSELQGSNSMSFDEICDNYGNELSYICSRNENYIENAYKNILSENFTFPGLRDIMLYQLNALKCAFMKINLLNTARLSGC
ncbi:MAG: hypothetical protein WKF35_01305 [Ferruginibacter sp.]